MSKKNEEYNCDNVKCNIFDNCPIKKNNKQAECGYLNRMNRKVVNE